MWTFDVLTFFEVSLQVHCKQRWARGVVGATDWSVVTTGFVFSAETQGVGACRASQSRGSPTADQMSRSYLRVDSLIVNGQPSGSTS